MKLVEAHQAIILIDPVAAVAYGNNPPTMMFAASPEVALARNLLWMLMASPQLVLVEPVISVVVNPWVISYAMIPRIM
jgi:hypothetical protein